MIKVAERLNSSVKKTLTALESNDVAYLTDMAVKQAKAGADYIDINAALLGEREAEGLKLLADLVLEHTKCGIMIDSPNPYVIEPLLDRLGDRPYIINSVALDNRLMVLKGVIQSRGCGVVVLPMAEHIPATAHERVECAKRLADELDIPHNRLYIDALAVSVASEYTSIKTTLDSIAAIRKALPEAHITCGASNVSFGLPKREIVNAAFLIAAIYAGLDSAIIDITRPAIVQAIVAGSLIAGYDEYCMDYITYIRESE